VAVLLAIVAPTVLAAGGPVEVRLRGGETMRAKEAVLRDGSWRIELPSGIRLSLPESKVLAVSELSGDREPRPPRVSGLNYSGAPDSRAGPELELARGAADLALSRRVSTLRNERREAEAEDLLRGELVRVPGDPLRLVLLGQVLVDGDRFREALQHLRLAKPAQGDRGLRRMRGLSLAEAYSRLDRVDEALRVLAATPEDAAGTVAMTRARLLRDHRGSEGLQRVETPRFSVHLPDADGRLDTGPLLSHLDAAWNELERALGGAPQERVVVAIYPGTEFWETTGMGGNVGGLYDGKVRVPSGSLDPPSPRLAAVLRHELAHAFVDALTGGRAGSVWHEGIAEHFEGSAVIPALERQLAARFRQGAWPPPYDHPTAHSRVEWFLERFGSSGLRDLLREWARRGTIDAALQAVVGFDEAAMELAWARALEEKWER
jgi:hypothetical protein